MMLTSSTPMTSSEGGGGPPKPSRGGKKAQQQRQLSPVPRKNSSASDKDEDAVLQSIASLASKTAVLHSPQVTLTCYIPSQSVGAVIGRRGSTIAQIQRHAQQYGTVRVSIVGHDDTSESVPYTFTELDWSSPDWTPVVIRGDTCAALCAAQRLRDVAGGDMDHVVLDVPLNRSNFAKLIGKRGMVLASLSADTNVRIMVPQRALRIDLFQLEGELDNVKLCLEKIVILLSSLKKKTSGEENTVSASVQVPTLPSQTKLRVVARKTETSLQKKRQADESWLITVWGQDAAQVENAIGMLETWKMHNTNNSAAAKQMVSATTPPQRRSRVQNRKTKSGKKAGGKGGSTPTQSTGTSSPPATPPEAPKTDS
jgi:predicted RNA-binding protein YlqC (UPF0109 family)